MQASSTKTRYFHDMDDPNWEWPAWKFDMKREDLFTKLHDQYNIYSSTIQDPEAFHHDIAEICHEADSVAEFHRLAGGRKHQRLAELDKALESASFEIIANPCLVSATQWQHAVQLFRTQSFDSIVRYFGSYLPSDSNRHSPPYTATPIINNAGFMTGFCEGDNEWTRPCASDHSNYSPLQSFSPSPADLCSTLATYQCGELDERTHAVTSAAILSSIEAGYQRFPPLVSSTLIISSKEILNYENEPSITPESDALKEPHENKRACYQQACQEENSSAKKHPETFAFSKRKLESQRTGHEYGGGLALNPVVTPLATAISADLPETTNDPNNAIHVTNRSRGCNKRKRP